MQITSLFKTFFTAGIVVCIISCNSDSKQQVKVTEVTLQDITQEKEKRPEPPPPPPPKVEMKEAEKKCYTNDGLQYKTVVTIFSGGNDVVGNVSSEDLGSGNKQTTEFTGTISGEAMIIKFKGEPPVVGATSEWTNNVWTIKKTGGKEILHIIFNAKNYETNKWQDTDYKFEKVDCK